jgi:hypothetical protein
MDLGHHVIGHLTSAAGAAQVLHAEVAFAENPAFAHFSWLRRLPWVSLSSVRP